MSNQRRLNIRVAEATNILAEGIVGVEWISDHEGQIAAQGERPLWGQAKLAVSPQDGHISRHGAERTWHAAVSRHGLIEIADLKKILRAREVLSVVIGCGRR